MPLTTDLLDLMPATVQVAPLTGRDDFGKPTYGTDVGYRARVTYRPKLVRDFQGQEVVTSGEVWLHTTAAITPQHRLTLPDGSRPVVARVERPEDEDGPSHVKVFFL